MGGLFSSSPPSAPPPPPPVDTGAEDRKRRLEAIERRCRGRAGTIATSERGVTDPLGGGSANADGDDLKDKLGD